MNKDEARKLKATSQLGMNPSKAANRLRKQLLFKYVRKCGENICYRCGLEIATVEEFTIEHKKPWLDSNDPYGLFWGEENLAFSHPGCNSRAARRPHALPEGEAIQRRKHRDRTRKSHEYTPEARRARYLKYGC